MLMQTIPGYSEVLVNFEPDDTSLVDAARRRVVALARSWNLLVHPDVERALAAAMNSAFARQPDYDDGMGPGGVAC